MMAQLACRHRKVFGIGGVVRLLTAAFVVLLVAVALAQDVAKPSSNSGGELSLDLVPFRDLSPILRLERPISRLIDHTPRPKLSATLLPLSTDINTWGDQFEFQLVLENVGTLPVALPWAADGAVPSESDHQNAHVYRAFIHIEIGSRDGTRRLAMLDPLPTAGTRGIPGTLQEFPPGRVARLRIPYRWVSYADGEAQRVLREPQGLVHVMAVYSLLDETLAVTSNAQPVSFRPR